VVLPEASLGWWQDSSFVTTPGRIIDISLYGCQVESRRSPGRSAKESIWLCPLEVSPRDWAEGIIISANKPFFGSCQLRIRFIADFPYEAFKMLVYGPNKSLEVGRLETPEHEKDHLWR
jgi:hypothetical protein